MIAGHDNLQKKKNPAHAGLPLSPINRTLFLLLSLGQRFGIARIILSGGFGLARRYSVRGFSGSDRCIRHGVSFPETNLELISRHSLEVGSELLITMGACDKKKYRSKAKLPSAYDRK